MLDYFHSLPSVEVYWKLKLVWRVPGWLRLRSASLKSYANWCPIRSYCWWKKSQTTTWDVHTLVNDGKDYLSLNWWVCRISSINSTIRFLSTKTSWEWSNNWSLRFNPDPKGTWVRTVCQGGQMQSPAPSKWIRQGGCFFSSNLCREL